MRALALLLVVAVPSVGLAQQKTVLDGPVMDPTFEQPMTKHLLPDTNGLKAEDEKTSPLLSRWYFWAGAATAVAVLAAIIGGVAVAMHHSTPPLTQSDFRCAATGCDGWVNKPTP